MQNVVGLALVAMATKFGLGAEIQSPTGTSLFVWLSVNAITPELLEISSQNFLSITWGQNSKREAKFENG